MSTIKFVWNGIKVDGHLFRCFYSQGPYTATSGLPGGTITLYARDERLPRLPGMEIHNDTDVMTDYFETDTVRVRPGSTYYQSALDALKAAQIHEIKQAIKRLERMLAMGRGTRYETACLRELEPYRAKLAALLE